jgi:hypothetical protein
LDSWRVFSTVITQYHHWAGVVSQFSRIHEDPLRYLPLMYVCTYISSKWRHLLKLSDWKIVWFRVFLILTTCLSHISSFNRS